MKIIRMLLIILFVILLYGCSWVEKLPKTEFDEFHYHRGGNITSADIDAEKGVLQDDGTLKVKSVHVTQDYGPFWTLDMRIDGLKIRIEQ